MQVVDATEKLFHALAKSDAALLEACLRHLPRPLQASLHWVFLATDKRVQESAFRLLCTCGCNVDELNPSGDTPLIRAVVQGNNNVISCLLKLDADVNLTNNKLETPLFHAALQSNFYAVFALVQAGADPNIATALGTTPLMCLFVGEVPAQFAIVIVWMARVLRGQSASTQMVNTQGDNAVDYYFRSFRHHLDDKLTQQLGDIMLQDMATSQTQESSACHAVAFPRIDLVQPSCSDPEIPMVVLPAAALSTEHLAIN